MRYLRKFRSGKAAIPIVIGVGLAWVTGGLSLALGAAEGGFWATAFTYAGFAAGSMLGSMLIAERAKLEMPRLSTYPIQSSAKGGSITKIYGSRKIAGNVVYLGPEDCYAVKHSSGGGKGGGGGADTTEYKYRRDFLLALCEGPAYVTKVWENKKEMDLDICTYYNGDGNAGLNAVMTAEGAPYIEHPNITFAWFDAYELGNNDRLPNFTFEVNNGEAPPDVTWTDISTLAELQAINNDLTKNYRLVNDIDASETASWNWNAGEGTYDGFIPLGNGKGRYGGFTGHFDGQGYTIKNLYMHCDVATSETYFAGLFANIVGEGKKVINLNVIDADINIRCFSTLPCIGILAGAVGQSLSDKDCLVKNCSVSGTITITGTGNSGYIGGFAGAVVASCDVEDCIADVTIVLPDNNSYFPGGFVGLMDNAATVTNCHANIIMGSQIYNMGGFVSYCDGGVAKPCIIEKCSVRGTITSANQDNTVGGCVHKLSYTGSEIRNCYSEVTITVLGGWEAEIDCGWGGFCYETVAGSVIDNCFYSGLLDATVTATDQGGFNAINNGTITNCYWNKTTSMWTKNTGGGSGLTAIEMTDSNNFTGWDFDDVWAIVEAVTIPRLRKVITFQDTNPAHIVYDIFTNDRYGAGLSPALINIESFITIGCWAAGKYHRLSLVLNQRRPALDWVDYTLSHFKGFLIRSGFEFKLGAFRNETSTFTINRDNLVVDVANEEDDVDEPPPPVQIKKRLMKQASNCVQISWTDPDRGYDNSVAVANDETDQRLSGEIKTESIRLDGITDGGKALEMAYRYMYESLYRFESYSFKLSYKDMAIETGDVGLITDGYTLDNKKIRITSMSESEDGSSIEVDAIEDETYLYEELNQSSATSERDEDETPAPTSPVVHFEESNEDKKLNMFFIPQDKWATGWFVYKSYDDVNFTLIGYHGAGDPPVEADGVLVTAIPAAETVMYQSDAFVDVDVETAHNYMSSASDEDFLNNASIMKIGNEIIGFKNADIIEGGTKRYRLTGLIRGLFGTDPVAHAVDDPFFTMIHPFKVPYELDDIGKTMYFKCLTMYGRAIQQLADVSSNSYTIVGRYKMPMPVTRIRQTDREGFTDYAGAGTTLEWDLCSKTSGFNIGAFNWDDVTYAAWPTATVPDNDGILFGAYLADPNIEMVVLRFEELDGTLIGEENLAADDESEALEYVADFNSKDPVRVKIIPTSNLRCLVENSILLDRI